MNTVATLNFGGIRRAYTLTELLDLAAPPDAPRKERAGCLDSVVGRTVRHATEAALVAAAGHIPTAAKALGVSIRTVYYNCERFDIRPADYRESSCATE